MLLLYFYGLSNGILIMGGNNYFSFFDWIKDIFEVVDVVEGGWLKVINNWVLIVILHRQSGLLHNIGSSYQFGSKLQVFMLGKLDFIESSLERAFEVVLNGGYDIYFILVVFFLKLFWNWFDGSLDIGLLCVYQNPEIICILSRI